MLLSVRVAFSHNPKPLELGRLGVALIVPALGAELTEMVLEALAVQPPVPVTTTVYVPAVLTVMAGVVAPVLQR